MITVIIIINIIIIIIIIIIITPILLSFCVQVIVQRALAARSLAHAKGGCVMATFLKVLPMFIIVFPGMISRVLFTDDVACTDPDVCMEVCESKIACSNIAYPKLVVNVMPIGAYFWTKGYNYVGLAPSWKLSQIVETRFFRKFQGTTNLGPNHFSAGVLSKMALFTKMFVREHFQEVAYTNPLLPPFFYTPINGRGAWPLVPLSYASDSAWCSQDLSTGGQSVGGCGMWVSPPTVGRFFENSCIWKRHFLGARMQPPIDLEGACWFYNAGTTHEVIALAGSNSNIANHETVIPEHGIEYQHAHNYYIAGTKWCSKILRTL